jgi:uncharacterized protein (DUF1800 family)
MSYVALPRNHNAKGAPNGYFAREVMELFTMGVGNYTEQDVREDSAHFAAATTSEFFGDRVHHRVWRGPAP